MKNRKKMLLELGIIIDRGNNKYTRRKNAKELIEKSNIDINEYESFSDDLSECIYRFIRDDKEIKKCIQCGVKVKFINNTKGWQEFCSVKCSSKYKAERGICKVNTKGWKHSEKSKKQMSENHADFKGDKNPLRIKMKEDPNFAEKLKKAALLKWSSYSKEKREEICSSMSLAQSKIIIDNPKLHRKHKSGHFVSDKMSKTMFYRSSYELKVCNFLEECKNVLSYEIEPFSVKYENMKNKIRYTRPDFLIEMTDGRKIIAEVKPKTLIEYENNPYKINGLRKYCEKSGIYEFMLFTENEIENMEKTLCIL